MNKNCHEYNMIWKLSESDTMSLWTYMYSLAIACLLILFWCYCAFDKVGSLNSDMLIKSNIAKEMKFVLLKMQS